jgi:hypothetical protein
MNPVSPVVNGLENEEVVYADDQPEYSKLPCLKSRKPDGTGSILTRWTFTEEERRAIANGADVFLRVLTYQHPLQPIGMFVCFDDEELLKYFLENYR